MKTSNSMLRVITCWCLCLSLCSFSIAETPTKLTSRQKELLKEFDECSDVNSNPIHDKFVEKIKNLFS